MFSLKPTDSIISAWAEQCSGPGWANQLVHVLIVRNDISDPQNGLLMETVQCLNGEATAAILTLFGVSAQANKSMVMAVLGLFPEDDPAVNRSARRLVGC